MSGILLYISTYTPLEGGAQIWELELLENALP